jgi:hypothetical protein
MALSIEEQRILDAMETELADDDPRLAARLAGFGQPRLPVLPGSRRARAITILVSMALAAVVAVMVYSMRPYPAGTARHTPPQRPQVAARASAQPQGSSAQPPSAQPPSAQPPSAQPSGSSTQPSGLLPIGRPTIPSAS